MPKAWLSNGEVRESLVPRLRLFLSADIVGSTAFKQRSSSESEQWFGLVRSFYMMAERSFAYRWALAKDRYQEAERPLLFGEDAPELWKTIGDEVLFTKEITHASEAMMCMSIWLQVLEGLRELLNKSRLDVKSTAWLADFPIRNREIFLRTRGRGRDPSANDEGNAVDGDATHQIDPAEDLDWLNDRLYLNYKSRSPNVSRDFIGQSIDTGFRVGAAASARMLMLSVELAHMLSKECDQLDFDPYRIGAFPVRSFTFRYDGRHALKGVLNGTPYPLIWLDVEPAKRIHVAEDVLSARPSPTPRQVHEFTSSLISEFPTRFCTMLDFLDDRVPTAYRDYEKVVTESIKKLDKQFTALEENRKLKEQAVGMPENGLMRNSTNVNSLLASFLAYGHGGSSAGPQVQARPQQPSAPAEYLTSPDAVVADLDGTRAALDPSTRGTAKARPKTRTQPPVKQASRKRAKTPAGSTAKASLKTTMEGATIAIPVKAGPRAKNKAAKKVPSKS